MRTKKKNGDITKCPIYNIWTYSLSTAMLMDNLVGRHMKLEEKY
jgi:hypothetical protein